MGYIQNFKQKFPDKTTPELIKAFHAGKHKVDKFDFKDMKEHENECSGILFVSDENEARKTDKYVTQVMLGMGRIVSRLGPPRTEDVIYMLSKCPNKKELLKAYDENEREAFFKATDHVMKGGTANKCYAIIANEFYNGNPELFAKRMTDIKYDATALFKGEEAYSYIVFNPKCIEIVNQ